MKTASIPAVRVSPDLREAAERVLRDGETLSAFVEASIREQVHARESQEAFIARGLAAREEAQRTGEYFTVDEVLDGLDAIAEENARAGDT
ncbi:YlcI/YnfO family protein [Salinisphaera sp. C84B14]|uniref:YlcI/YnfO family protein n=1 Tax=Salinisphaera sp. C84B14 TaxID=1304155 RepID=UPI003341C2FC